MDLGYSDYSARQLGQWTSMRAAAMQKVYTNISKPAERTARSNLESFTILITEHSSSEMAVHTQLRSVAKSGPNVSTSRRTVLTLTDPDIQSLKIDNHGRSKTHFGYERFYRDLRFQSTPSNRPPRHSTIPGRRPLTLTSHHWRHCAIFSEMTACH